MFYFIFGVWGSICLDPMISSMDPNIVPWPFYFWGENGEFIADGT